jgi:hypothetical protein
MGAIALAKFDSAGGRITKDTPIPAGMTSTEYADTLTLFAGHANLSSKSRMGAWRGGLYKSTNGGRSWKPLDQTKELRNLDIRAIVPHESQPDTLLVAALDPSGTILASGGVYKSTNGGKTFNVVHPHGASHLVTDPGNPSVFYAATPGVGVYVSSDHGDNWKLVTDGLNSILDDGIDDDWDGTAGTAAKPEPDERVQNSVRIELAVHNSNAGNAVYVVMVGSNGKIMSVHRSTTANLTSATPDRGRRLRKCRT